MCAHPILWLIIEVKVKQFYLLLLGKGCTVVSRKRAHYGLSAHPPVLPRFNFLLRSKTYLKERPPSASIANRNFHCLASLTLWFTHTARCKLCCCTVVYTSTRCLAQDVTHDLHRFERLVVHNIGSSNVGPPHAYLPLTV